MTTVDVLTHSAFSSAKVQLTGSKENSGLKHTLGRGNRGGRSWINFHREAQCSAKGFKNSFNLVVGIFAAKVVDVQGNQRVIYKTLKKFVK